MKALRNQLLAIAGLALASVLAGSATAQAKASGSFTLPFEAKWGNTVLPPGDYTLTVNSTSFASNSTYWVTFDPKGQRGQTIVSVQDRGPKAGEKNMLVAVRSGGAYRIRTLRLPIANLILNFPAPKDEQALIAKAPELIESVPILVAMK